jgi:hypothetical protein
LVWRRVRGLLTRPAAEWRTIAAEQDDIAWISQSYVSLLALIPCLSLFGGLMFEGGTFLGAVAIYAAMTGCMVNWVVSLGTPIAAATIIDKLSPLFDADSNATAAFKLVAYSCTPLWLLGIFYISPALQPAVALGAVWSVALLCVGAPIVMKVARGRVLAFTASSAVVIVAVHAALRAAFGAFSIPYMGY